MYAMNNIRYPHASAITSEIENQLKPYGFVNLTSSDDEFPSLSYLGDGDRFFEIRVQIGTFDGGADDIFVHTNFEECGAVYGYSNYFETIIYHGKSIADAVYCVKQIHNAFVIYSYMVSEDYRVISTGGGCTAWSKTCAHGDVMVCTDSSANLVDELPVIGDYECARYSTSDFAWMVICDGDGVDHFEKCLPLSDTLGFTQALKNLEAHANSGVLMGGK